MTDHYKKTVAYVDRQVGDEILEIETVDVLPRRGQPVTFADGDGKGDWDVYDVKRIDDTQFDALVELIRRT